MNRNPTTNYDLIDRSPIPFAHKRVVKNGKGEIIDFVFIHINLALEKMLGFSNAEITGKSEIDLFHLNRAKVVDGMRCFANLIFNGQEVNIDQYSEALGKWFRTRLVADGEDKVFIWFFDITPEKTLLNHSRDIFESKVISCKMITKRAAQIAGSAFTLFCEFDKTLKSVKQADTCYHDSRFDDLSDYLLSDYAHIPILPEYENYQRLQPLDLSRVNDDLRQLIARYGAYDLSIQPVKIENKLIGAFAFLFYPEQTGKNEDLIASYAEQVGLYLFSQAMKDQQSNIEKRLQNEKTKHYLINQHTTDGFAIFEENQITYASAAYSKLLGYSEEAIAGIDFKEMINRIHPEDRDRIVNLIEKAHRQKSPGTTYRYRVMKKDGQYIWLEDKIRIFYEGDKRVKTYINSRDVSEQIFYEKGLMESEEKFRMLLENVQDSVFVHEIDEHGMPGRFIFVNHIARERLGYTMEEFQNLLVKDIDTVEKAANIPHIMQTLFKEGKVVFQGAHVSKDGRIIPVEVSSGLITLDGKRLVISVSHDLSEKVKALKREKKDKELLQSILNTLPGKLVAVDDERRIIAANEKALYRVKTDDKTVDEIIGKKCHEVFRGRTIPCETCKIDKMSVSKEPFSEIIVEQKEGEEVQYSQFFYTPVFNVGGKASGLVEYKEDITDLIQAQKKAEEANRVKTAFMMNMSHELRTPLNGIIGFSNIIESTDLNEEQKQYIQNIKTSGYHLLGIINDILDFSKLQTHQLELKREPVNLKKLLKLSLSLIKKQALDKGVQTILKVDSNLPETILCDQLRLSQVIGNLLYNAVKFTQNGSITLSAALVRHLDDEIIVQIAVRDTGIGIGDKKKNAIFDSFTQADSSLTRQFGGTGLGLTISNNILKLVNSHIELDSQPGKGSCFSFDLTVKAVKETTGEDRTASISIEKNNTFFSLLAVDDNPMNLKINTLIIKRQFPNVKLFTAVDGDEAVKQYLLERPDIILMDIRMAGKDGITATDEIRKMQKGDVHIIGVSADVQPETIKTAFKKGVDEYLTKPFNPRQLIRKINNYLLSRG